MTTVQYSECETRTRSSQNRVEDANYRWRAALHRFFLHRIKNEADAEDLTQDVLLSFLRVNPPEEIQNEAGYLFRIAGNVLQRFRFLNARDCVVYNSDLFDACSLVLFEILSQNPEYHLSTTDYLHNLLERVPEHYRQAYLLRYAGYNYAQISVELHISPQSVQKYLARAEAYIRGAG